jgi:hypothetical protein
MSETQISQIKVRKENLHKLGCDCGGAYRVVTAKIHIDNSEPLRNQKISLIHEILGTYLGVFIDPNILTEMAEQIVDSLDQL